MPPSHRRASIGFLSAWPGRPQTYGGLFGAVKGETKKGPTRQSTTEKKPSRRQVVRSSPSWFVLVSVQFRRASQESTIHCRVLPTSRPYDSRGGMDSVRGSPGPSHSYLGTTPSSVTAVTERLPRTVGRDAAHSTAGTAQHVIKAMSSCPARAIACSTWRRYEP